MIEAPAIRPMHEVAIAVSGRDETAPTPEVLVGTLPDGRGRSHRLVIGPADGAEMIRAVLDGRGHNGNGRAHELVRMNGELTEWLRAQSPEEVYFVLGGRLDDDFLAGIGARLLMEGVALHFVLPPALGQLPVVAASAEIGGRSCISLHAMQDAPGLRVIRRLVDALGAALLLVLLSPVLLAVAAVVRWRMGSPILHVQQRIGRAARRFRLYKFRSMVPNAEGILRASPEMYRRYVASSYKLPEAEDPRITPLGRFLRRTSLDELPQLWNVLRGDMSLVGPRPVVPEEVREYGDYARMLLRVKPGLTGAWQVAGRSAVGYPERARMDLRYVATRSIADDLRILLRTLPAVLQRRGAL